MIRYFYLTNKWGSNWYYQFGPKKILHIPQISRTAVSPSNSLMLYLEHSVCTEVQSAYSTAPADVLASHRFGRVCPRSGGSRSLTGILEPQGAVPPDFTTLRRGWVYRLVPEALLFRGMQTGPEAILEPPGACGLRSRPT